jgi:hypothetical protein
VEHPLQPSGFQWSSVGSSIVWTATGIQCMLCWRPLFADAEQCRSVPFPLPRVLLVSPALVDGKMQNRREAARVQLRTDTAAGGGRVFV